MKGLTPNSHVGRAEAVVLPRLAAEPIRDRPRHGPGIPLDRDVHVHGLGAANEVPDGAAHQINRRKPLQRGEELLQLLAKLASAAS